MTLCPRIAGLVFQGLPSAHRFCMDSAKLDPACFPDGRTRSQRFEIQMFLMMLWRDLRGEIGGSRTIYRSDSERSEGGGAQRGAGPEFLEAEFMGGGPRRGSLSPG